MEPFVRRMLELRDRECYLMFCFIVFMIAVPCYGHESESLFDGKTLYAGKELRKETLPLQSGSRVYRLQGLKSNSWYEVKISYPASIPALFSLQLLRNGEMGLKLKQTRRLLNTEKLIFKTESFEQVDDKDGLYVLVTVEPEGIVAIPNFKERSFIIYNIVCEEQLLGIAYSCCSVVVLVVLCLVVSVTFRDPEAARRACVDATPIIDGRRANCNLASLGRPRLPMHYAMIPNLPGRIRPPSPYVGSVQGPRGSLFGSHPYQQPPAYSYQQGMMYPYGVTPYGPEYMYSQSQGLYGPYTGQQYLQVYGVPGAVNSPGYQYGHLSQNIPGYTAIQGYSVPGSHIQSPYPSAIAGPSPTQSHVIVQTPQHMQSSGSDQTTG